MRAKYHNRKVRTKDGVMDSSLEYHRYLYLLEQQKAGKISDLLRQVEFEIIPQQTIQETVTLKTKIKTVTRVVERAVSYIADFVYKKDGQTVIEDAKSEITRKNRDYVMKRKLMRLHGHPIREVYSATEKV